MSDIRKVVEEKMVSSELIFDGRVVHLYCDEVALPDGKTSVREYVKHIGAVCIVPVTDEGEIICVRQYRYAVGRTVLEIPAGKLDSKAEIPLEAAIRELREETGAVAKKITYMGEYFSSPAILDERIYMYLAEELSFGECQRDDDEFLTLERMPIEEIVDKILAGEVPDGKTQAAVLRAYLMKKKRTEK
jgi:ADP-ribose pyrophosphatase